MARSAYFGKNDILPDFLTDQNSEDQNSDIFRQQIAADRLRDVADLGTPQRMATHSLPSLNLLAAVFTPAPVKPLKNSLVQKPRPAKSAPSLKAAQLPLLLS